MHVGFWWEKFCREAVTGNTVDGIVFGEARRWWGSVMIDGKPQEVEIDLVAESIDHQYILIGECKWTECENAKTLTARLEKIAPLLSFTKGKTIICKLFLRHKPTHSQKNHLLPKDIVELG